LFRALIPDFRAKAGLTHSNNVLKRRYEANETKVGEIKFRNHLIVLAIDLKYRTILRQVFAEWHRTLPVLFAMRTDIPLFRRFGLFPLFHGLTGR
jgi:hypothetical protein